MEDGPRETFYVNTDFDLKSAAPFDALHRELAESCHVLHYTHVDGTWYSIVEAACVESTGGGGAARDIMSMAAAVSRLSPTAKAELAACSLREFNVGFDCWDTWSYVHAIPSHVIRAVADIDCSLAVTLYPMRKPDGTPKED